MGRVGALLLAAGESSRMGALKALLPWGCKNLLIHQVTVLNQAALRPIIVVTGHRACELKSSLANYPQVHTVFNTRYREGKTTSIKAGLAALRKSNPVAILVLNVDQPRSINVIQLLVKEHQRNSSLITIPTYAGKSGHPVIFSSTLLEELSNISEETQGLKAVVLRNAKNTNYMAVDSREVLFDLNTDEDYLRALKEHGLD